MISKPCHSVVHASDSRISLILSKWLSPQILYIKSMVKRVLTTASRDTARSTLASMSKRQRVSYRPTWSIVAWASSTVVEAPFTDCDYVPITGGTGMNNRNSKLGMKNRSSHNRRAGRDRRSEVDTRSEEDKRLVGERRSGSDRRSGADRRAPRPS